MKTNLKSYLKTKLKRKLEGDDEEEEDTGGGYVEDLRKSEVCKFIIPQFLIY